MLLYLPCCWSISLATTPGELPDPATLIKFLAGAILARSAGCVINDTFDKDLDRNVPRTVGRPMADGRIGFKEALCLSFILMMTAFGILLTLDERRLVLV
ncbi:4-hydroxybenzoate polyprenyltransferase, mitochondrial [Thelohanellus kitauei]|uniref:4-hydroxybenzoate polyprenyltransferase, mitochondrial n=1 Tax=Thelohanellus kitauei TaxID=669202 RepID=A0A0C2IBU2_THEKT|nr:4-hydroxybenzoate polyprenyltransferase, mitochondrial [Thelohanellus kitauei]